MLNNRMKKLIIAILTIAAVNCHAQGDKFKKTAIQNITGNAFVHYYARLNGTPFYNQNWLAGDVTMKSGDVYKGLPLRYDAFRDELVYFNEINNNAIIIDKYAIVGFTLTNNNGDIELFEPMYDKGLRGMNGRYMSILLKDSISVIRKHEAMEEKYNTINSSGKTGEILHKTTTYTWNGKELSSVPKRRGAIFNQYPAHKDELRKFCFQHHIHMKEKNDIILLYKEINRLIKADSQAGK